MLSTIAIIFIMFGVAPKTIMPIVESTFNLTTLDVSFAFINTLMFSLSCILGLYLPLLISKYIHDIVDCVAHFLIVDFV